MIEFSVITSKLKLIFAHPCKFLFHIFLTDKETLLSPVILCGPLGVHLKKSAIITFQHCALLNTQNWKISIHASDSGTEEENPEWKVIFFQFQS